MKIHPRNILSRLALALTATTHLAAAAINAPCKIEVVDKENGWPVPMVELRTTGDQLFVTDNAGVVAFDSPQCMGRETWLSVFAHGYEVKKDSFGHAGVRFTPTPGGTFRIEIQRRNIAKRLGRLTGSGLFAESQKMGGFKDWKESGIVGSDTAETTSYKGKIYTLWGDTNVFSYPLGIFNTPLATSSLRPLISTKPPTGVLYDYVRDGKGAVRGTAPMPSKGPVWLSGFVSLPDAKGKEHLVANYSKILGTMVSYEHGLCEWNEEKQIFEVVLTFWKKSDSQPEVPSPHPEGHPALWKDQAGRPWLYLGGPPAFKCPATYEAWKTPSQWKSVKNATSFRAADGSGDVVVASGAIAWNDYRKRWILILQQKFGKPSAFGEVWYVEGKTPEGPWGPAVKIVTHENYTFYNVQIDHQFTPGNQPILVFEGTYTVTFTDNKFKTPLYDYNQMLYRLDLDDPRLKPAQLN